MTVRQQTHDEPLLEVTDLVKHFPSPGGRGFRPTGAARAVDGVSLSIREGETLGLVGESGGGKTTLGLSMLRLLEPTSGSIVFEGRDVLEAGRAELKRLRCDMQMVFQDPLGALDPRMTIADCVGEGLRIHRLANRKTARERAIEMLDVVGIDRSQADSLPRQMSGGQLQRVGLARALILDPKLVVCDEPVSALDVSIQAQIINLLIDLRNDRGLSYLFVAHNLSVVEHVSDRVAVMYLGVVVEMADTVDIFAEPQHPYTRALISAIPKPRADLNRNRVVLTGDPPSPMNPPSGCRFRTRCPSVMPRCSEEVPDLREIAPGHWTACFLHH